MLVKKTQQNQNKIPWVQNCLSSYSNWRNQRSGKSNKFAWGDIAGKSQIWDFNQAHVTAKSAALPSFFIVLLGFLTWLDLLENCYSCFAHSISQCWGSAHLSSLSQAPTGLVWPPIISSSPWPLLECLLSWKSEQHCCFQTCTSSF